ncbi:MAG TPA: cupin domain-containing protein [Nitrospira sp.]|nr:cupin domain-containing protein [Nitrospira sp.]
MNIDAIRADWRSRGFSCDVWTDPPGQVWEDYRHSVDEVVMVIQGDVEFEIQGVVYRPSPGEELLIPAGVLHSVRNKGQDVSLALWL